MDRLKKTDRLLKLWFLILRNPGRYSTKELAEKFQVNIRTIYRDIMSMGVELEVPVYSDKNKWIIDDTHFLPPVRFSKPEALSIFLAARLMASYLQRYDPYLDSTFSTLASIMPSPLNEQIQGTLDWLHGLPRDERYISTMARLAEAWITRHSIKVVYRSYDKKSPEEKVLDPYFIEPVSSGMASYLLAFCHINKEVRTYKVERIESLQLLAETYVIPPEYNPNLRLDNAIGIMSGGKVVNVKLRIKKELSRIMEEISWHPSQKNIHEADGSLVVTLKVAESVELIRWVLGWGHQVEVLSPVSLRKAIALNAQLMIQQYDRQLVLPIE